MGIKKDYEFKSSFIKRLLADKDTGHGDIKDYSKINFSNVLEFVLNGASIEEIQDICNDINYGNIKIGMDANSVNLIVKNQDNENIKKLLHTIKPSMSIDINGLKELGSEDFHKIQALGCKIDKVYVNSGFDEAAARGYNVNVYNTIITKAEKMVQSALKKLPKDASEEERFMAIYNVVIKNSVYDYSALKSTGERQYTSRNLEGFFVDGTSICAGTADVLKQLCEMNGIEAEYVQGDAQSKRENKSCYHAWVKVKIDGKWYNADPTWDANKVGKPYEFCLKGDKEFQGHTLDTQYNPNYMRDGEGKSVVTARRQYHSSYESRDSSDLQNKYYTDELARKSGGRALTEEEINALNGRPDSAGIMPRSNSIIDIIINAILNFGRWSKEKVGGIFKKHNISQSDVEALSGKPKNEVEEYAKSIHFETEKQVVTKSINPNDINKTITKDDRSR